MTEGFRSAAAAMVPLLLLSLGSTPALAAIRDPIIDVHMHALHADDQGPPPMGMCTPIVSMPVWDQRDILYNNAARFLRLTPAQMVAQAKMGRS